MPEAQADRLILRELAQRVAELAARPEQAERARLWRHLNALKPERPLVLADPQGGWRELVPEETLRCQDPLLRSWELALRRKLYRHAHIPDDHPLTATLNVSWVIEVGDYGLRETQMRTDALGSYRWDPPLKTHADFARLHPREIIIRREASLSHLALAQECVGDLLDVRLVGETTCRAKLTRDLIHLRGLDQLLLDMYDDPPFLHAMMTFMRDEKLREWTLYEREGLLSLNNGPENLMGSGGICHTDELPAPDFSGAVRMRDMWCWGEAQETVGVGPTQFDEFVLQYQLPLLNRFGLVDYGCCEPLDRRFDLLIRQIPRLRSVSVSPWCNRAEAAEKLGDRYVYVYKPNPAYLCAPRPDWDALECELRETLAIARGCCVSLIMKDTHTFCHEPQRLTRWAALASRLAVEHAG